jgi:hypothetical protein
VITVTRHQLFNQLAEGSATNELGHQVWLDSEMQILTEDGPRPAQQATWYLHLGDWAPVWTTCEEPTCLVLAHLTDSQTKAEEAKEEALLALVQRTSVSLADLYRKGKKRGLLTPRTEYGG